MTCIWRFFLNSEQRWQWQVLAFDQSVVKSSTAGHLTYEHCVADAERHGYRFIPPQLPSVARAATQAFGKYHRWLAPKSTR